MVLAATEQIHKCTDCGKEEGPDKKSIAIVVEVARWYAKRVSNNHLSPIRHNLYPFSESHASLAAHHQSPDINASIQEYLAC